MVWTEMRTILFNLTFQPAPNVPVHFKDGLPVGLQIIDRLGDEARVLRVGAALEADTDPAALSHIHLPSIKSKLKKLTAHMLTNSKLYAYTAIS